MVIPLSIRLPAVKPDGRALNASPARWARALAGES